MNHNVDMEKDSKTTIPQGAPERRADPDSLWKFDIRVDVQNSDVVKKSNPRHLDLEAEPLPLHHHSALLFCRLAPPDCYPLLTRQLGNFQCFSLVCLKNSARAKHVLLLFVEWRFLLWHYFLLFRRTVELTPLAELKELGCCTGS